MEKRHRIFLAINLPKEVKKELSKYQDKWKDLPAKWVIPDNLHITLIFLGDLTELELGEVCVTTKNIVEKYNSFNINLNKVSYGPNEKFPPKMVWVSGEVNKELVVLKNELENSLLQKINFRPEGRGFTPHVTLARISSFGFRSMEIEERPEVNENIDLVFTAESIDVMESVLKRGGPQYTIIESNQLN